VGTVQRGRATAVGRVARLVVLVSTLVGLAAMHSLGQNGGAHAATMLADGHHPAAMAVAGIDTAGHCAGDGCAHVSARPGVVLQAVGPVV
jgi:hypothetical protein